MKLRDESDFKTWNNTRRISRVLTPELCLDSHRHGIDPGAAEPPVAVSSLQLRPLPSLEHSFYFPSPIMHREAAARFDSRD